MVSVLNRAGRLIERPGNLLRNLEGHKRFVKSTAPFLRGQTFSTGSDLVICFKLLATTKNKV